MLTNYSRSVQTENMGLQIIIPYIKHIAYKQQVIVTSKGALSKKFQEKIGDAMFNNLHQEMVAVELKTEEVNIYGNLFLEEWSNLKFDTSYRKTGWMYKLECDYLWYYFLNSDELYKIHFHSLFNWFFINDNKSKYELKPQRKCNQYNKTYGRCVKIIDLMQYEWCELVNPNAILLNINNQLSTIMVSGSEDDSLPF